MTTRNSFNARAEIRAGGQTVQIYSLPALEKAGFPAVSRLPYSMKILLENLLRREDDAFVKAEDIQALARWNATANVEKEISFMPARVLLQDFTGVPCVVDLAAMRDAMVDLGGNPDRINPLQPVELVIDHSVQVDYFARSDAFSLNAELEFSRNRERYAFLRWGQRAFRNFDVVPPDTGIVHQVNIEHLARVVFSEKGDGQTIAYPDTVCGTDSHTTTVNGLSLVGWGAGRTEAEQEAVYSDTVELQLGTVEPSLAGPKRPQDRVSLMNAKAAFQVALPTMQVAPKTAKSADAGGARQGVAMATGAVAQSGVAVADPALEELDHGAVG